MKPSKKSAIAEKKINSAGEVPIDPFAVDFFGGKPLHGDEIVSPSEKNSPQKKPTVPREKSDWFRNLPRITNREAELSAALKNLPENLTEESARIISEAIARYTFREPENVQCSIVSIMETNLSEAVIQISKSPQIFFTLGCQPETASAVIALNTNFASSVVDLILGGQGAESTDARNLSPIETAVVEFLAANILGEINQYLGEPLVCLQTVTEQLEPIFGIDERGGEIVFSIKIGDFSGFLTAFAPRSFLNVLDQAQNSLLSKKSERKKIGELEKTARAFDLNLQVGATSLDAESLAFLEPDDIVLIENSEISLELGFSGANLQICVGRGRNFRLLGTAEDAYFGGDLNFKIREIISEETRRKFSPVKFKMDEKENELMPETETEATDENVEKTDEETNDEQVSPSLENVQVALRVEIAADKISLRELQNLRAGQIIALGCRPTDPVRLVTDQMEEPVATGELVEIEGQLGVRLTKVFI